MTFNPTIKHDFEAGLTVDGREVESVEKMKLLGLTLTPDMKWRKTQRKLLRKPIVNYG